MKNAQKLFVKIVKFVLDIIFRRMHIDWIHEGMSKVNENARILREYEEKTREKAKQKRKTEIKNKPQNLNADKNKNEKVKKEIGGFLSIFLCNFADCSY